MERKPFSGVMTAIVSPFRPDSSLDTHAFLKILRMQKNAGIDGVVVAGTTGESPTLSLAEKISLLELALGEQSENFSIYIGTGTNSTEATLKEVRELSGFRAQGRGVDGVMSVVPYYNKPNQAGLRLHFSSIARSFPSVSFCLYNVPGRTACHLAPETFATLAQEFQNIVAIKEAAGDVLAMTRLRAQLSQAGVNRNIEILSGDDATFPAALVTGAKGVISVTSHIIPRTLVAILRAAQEGDLERVRALNTAAFPLSQGLFCAPNPVPVKYALSLHDFCTPTVRSPLAPLSEPEMRIVAQSLKEAELKGAQIL